HFLHFRVIPGPASPGIRVRCAGSVLALAHILFGPSPAEASSHTPDLLELRAGGKPVSSFPGYALVAEDEEAAPRRLRFVAVVAVGLRRLDVAVAVVAAHITALIGAIGIDRAAIGVGTSTDIAAVIAGAVAALLLIVVGLLVLLPRIELNRSPCGLATPCRRG